MRSTSSPGKSGGCFRGDPWTPSRRRRCGPIPLTAKLHVIQDAKWPLGFFREQNGATVQIRLKWPTGGRFCLNGVQKVVSSNLTAPTIFTSVYPSVPLYFLTFSLFRPFAGARHIQAIPEKPRTGGGSARHHRQGLRRGQGHPRNLSLIEGARMHKKRNDATLPKAAVPAAVKIYVEECSAKSPDRLHQIKSVRRPHE